MSGLDANSVGSYDSLFDDDGGTLEEICFDLDVQQVAMVGEEDCFQAPSPWCCSSSSACCSLCRLPAVSEADDESNFQGLLQNDAGSMSRTVGTVSRATVPFQRSQVVTKLTGKRIRASSCCDTCDMPCYGRHQVPVKTISIPSSCFKSSAMITEGLDESRPVSSTYHDYLSAVYLPDDALCHIVQFLDVSSLVQLRECNKKLYDMASSEKSGWRDHCTSLWARKANVSYAAKCMLAKSTSTASDTNVPTQKFLAMEAYKMAVTDANNRKEVSIDEICFDGAPDQGPGIIWSFRFKESAGQDWTSWDPWWKGREARKLVFLRDGTIRQVYPQGTESTAKNCCGTRLYDVFSERTIRRDGEDVPAPRIEMRWRLVHRPLDLPNRPQGAYVRVSVGGRDVPTYVVRRSPNGNWGFILESCWGVYASFEMAQRVLRDSSYRLGHGRRRLRRTRDGGSRWVHIDENDSADEDDGERERERMRNVRRRIDLFVEESAMTQDGYSQWREALLYNIGAVTLPEGNGDSTEEFDDAWQHAMMVR